MMQDSTIAPSMYLGSVQSPLADQVSNSTIHNSVVSGGCTTLPEIYDLQPHPSPWGQRSLLPVVSSLVGLVEKLIGMIGIGQTKTLYPIDAQPSRTESGGFSNLIGKGVELISSLFSSGSQEKTSSKGSGSNSFWGGIVNTVTSSDFLGTVLKSFF